MPPAADEANVLAQRGRRLLRVLFIVHGLVTLAAALVLAAAPAAIPATVGISLKEQSFLLAYFLAAAELAIALLSLGAARLTDTAALRLIVATLVVFHLATGLLEIVYLSNSGVSSVLVVNIAVRFVAVALLLFGWRVAAS